MYIFLVCLPYLPNENVTGIKFKYRFFAYLLVARLAMQPISLGCLESVSSIMSLPDLHLEQLDT